MDQISRIESADALAAIDFAVLDELRAMMPSSDGEEDVLAELVQALLADAPPRIAALETAIGARDAGAVLREAHGLKGGILSLGGLKAGAVCIAIEDAAREGDIDRAGAAMPDLVHSFEHMCAALEAVIR
jgi:HPt (histidine-containing phosphotransfer) domain-containing protein